MTVNAFRPGTVDTVMQTWIRDQNPARIGRALHEHFTACLSQGKLITPDRAASTLLAHLIRHSRAVGHVQRWPVASSVS